jgi:hypothetical protein
VHTVEQPQRCFDPRWTRRAHHPVHVERRLACLHRLQELRSEPQLADGAHRFGYSLVLRHHALRAERDHRLLCEQVHHGVTHERQRLQRDDETVQSRNPFRTESRGSIDARRAGSPAAPVESSRASPPHRLREDGLIHPADTSRTNLAAALRLLSRWRLSKPPHQPQLGRWAQG